MQETLILQGFFGRGSWIRTNDLQYPKLPRYQAALYPVLTMVDTRLRRPQQGMAAQPAWSTEPPSSGWC
jgi:hypothetical protein